MRELVYVCVRVYDCVFVCVGRRGAGGDMEDGDCAVGWLEWVEMAWEG